jgi:Domain of unknown function (DUF1814).
MLRWLLNLFRSNPSGPAPNPSEPSYDTQYTRPATWQDVLAVARLLNRQGVRYVLVGGYALAAHGYVRMTQDIDIAVAPDGDNARRWIAALAQLPDGACRELEGEADPFQGDYLHAIRINDEFTVDILPSVSGVPFTELERHVQWLRLEGELIPVLDLPGLLKTKQGLRPKDQADAGVLRANHRAPKRETEILTEWGCTQPILSEVRDFQTWR